jgi:Tol biopolymer transport system component
LAILPAWSPDGSTILYTARYDGRDGEGSGDLWSIRPDETAKTQVTRSPGTDQAATWSPDGQRIALYSDGSYYPNKAGIWTMGLDGMSREFVVRDGWGPSWRTSFTASPTSAGEPAPTSGRRIAYVAATDAGYDLFTVRPDGTRLRRLTFSGRVQEPVWSPDHSRIAYVANSSALRVIDVKSGETRRVARAEYDSGGPAWSPDGNRLAWGAFHALVVFDLRTRERHRIPLKDDGCCVRDPAWSPNGRRIAFSEEFGLGFSDIMIVPARGGRIRHVTRLKGEERHLDWSPNGRRIVFSHMSGRWWARGADVLSVKPDGTGIRSVMSTRQLDLTPAWSPNGSLLALYSDGPGRSGVHLSQGCGP